MDSELILDPIGAQVIGALLDGVLLVDAKGTIRYASQRAHGLFGALPPALVGCDVDRLVPVPSRARHTVHRQAVRAADGVRHGEARSVFEGCRLDGSVFSARITLAPIATAAGAMTLALIRPVGGVGIGEGVDRDRFAQTLFGLSLQLDAACSRRGAIDRGQLRAIADQLHHLVREFPDL